MSTLEKLFMQVFDRKQWIEEQFRQQKDSYEQSLAINLAASGRQLPSWLFDDGTVSRSDAPMPDYSNRTELNGKPLIADLLYPSSRVTTPVNHNAVFGIPSYKPTQSFQDNHFTGACFPDNHMQNIQANEEITSTSHEECHEEQSHIEPNMTNIGAFSTIQRSRSRQKGIEKRSSEKKAPAYTTTSFRQTDRTKADIFDKELIETSNQGRTGDGKERKQGETVQSSAHQIMNLELSKAFDCVETGVVGPKRFALNVASAISGDNLDFVVEKNDGTMDPEPSFILEKDLSFPVGESCRIRDGREGNEVEIPECSDSRLNNQELTETLNCTEAIAVEPKRLVFSLALAGVGNNLDSTVENHDETTDISPIYVFQKRGDGEERSEEISALVKGLSPKVVHPELTESPHCTDIDEVQGSHSPKGISCAIEGLQQTTKPSVGEASDAREVDIIFFARDSYSPIGDVTGDNKEATEVNEPMAGQMDLSELRAESPHISQPMEVIGEEVLALSDKRRHSVTSSFHEAIRKSTSLSEASFGSCRSCQTAPDVVVGPLVEDPKSVGTNLESLSTNPKSRGEGSLIKSGGVKRLPSGGCYFLRSSGSQEKSSASVLQDGIGAISSLTHSGEVQFHVNVNSWPKRRRMEVFSNSALATSPRPRKGPGLPNASYSLVEEDESNESVLVPEEYNRVPSRSSSSDDKVKASVSPTEPNIGSPTLDANHFSISPKEGDMANISKYALEIDVGTSLKYNDGSFIDQGDTRPELEAFNMVISSDSEDEMRNIPEIIPSQKERIPLLHQLSFSSCNLATPGNCFSTKYKHGKLSNLYKSVPTGHFDFMKQSEPFSVPANDRKQLSASVTSIPYQSGPFECRGFEMGLSTSGKSGKARLPLTPPVEKFGYRRGIPPLTPPAEKFSYRKLSGIVESGNGSGRGSGIRSSGKTPLHSDLTCFRIDEDTMEDDVPNDNNALEPLDLSAVLEESTLLSDDSQNLLEDDNPNYQNVLCDVTAVYENIEMGVGVLDSIPEEGGYTDKKPKQSAASLNKRNLGRNASESMESGLATTETVSKPSNIVSGVTSFVSLVKQKQQTVNKKREVRIPALEAAEAKKKIEEKKRNERDLQKAAMKAEREKLNQEKVLKKKLEEEQKKKEADIAAKKRQREERERKDKEKEKKRKCTELDRQTQKEEPIKKEPPKRLRVVREEKELRRNVTDEMGQSKREECGKEDSFVRPRETGSSIIIINAVEAPVLPRVAEKSYEMSPYKDSDEEGDGCDEVEEDKIRRRKFIPSWARKEFLEDYLKSKKFLNPETIFSSKCSFDMNKVLKPRIR